MIINKFNSEFKLINTIQSEKVNIENNLWLIENPMISKDNISTKYNDPIKLETNFDKERINSLFSNISTLSLLEYLH